MSGSFDLHSQTPLMLCADTRPGSWQYPTSITYVLSKSRNFLKPRFPFFVTKTTIFWNFNNFSFVIDH